MLLQDGFIPLCEVSSTGVFQKTKKNYAVMADVGVLPVSNLLKLKENLFCQ